MYKNIDIVSVECLLAESAAFADRKRYTLFMEEAERFAAREGLIVCGRAATRLLLGDPDNGDLPPPVALDSFQCDFYSGEAPSKAKALTEALYRVDPSGLGHYATMLSKIPGHLLLVAVDGRVMFTVTGLPGHRGVSTASALTPSSRPAQFARDTAGKPILLACAGPELQLMGTYTLLSNPEKASSWNDLISEEAGLRALYYSEAGAKHASAASRGMRAGPPPAPPKTWPIKAASELNEIEWPELAGRRSGRELDRFSQILIDQFATGPDRILVGSAALAVLAGRPYSGRVQIVSARPLAEEAEVVGALARKHGLVADWSVNDPKCPVDPRLRRLTVHLSRATDRREPWLDVFNSAAHELVPYATLRTWRAAQAQAQVRVGGSEARGVGGSPEGSLKIGTPFVMMRYRLADIWTLQVLLRIGAIGPQAALEVFGSLDTDFRRAADLYEALVASAESGPPLGEDSPVGECLLPGTAYIGTAEDPDLAMRRRSEDRPDARRFGPYLPAGAAPRGLSEAPGGTSEASSEPPGLGEPPGAPSEPPGSRPLGEGEKAGGWAEDEAPRAGLRRPDEFLTPGLGRLAEVYLGDDDGDY